MHLFDSLSVCYDVTLIFSAEAMNWEKHTSIELCLYAAVHVFVCVYLHQARHLSFLKWCNNGGSERLTVFYRSAFQEVFSCLIDVHLNHLSFELRPLRYQHLEIRERHIITAIFDE